MPEEGALAAVDEQKLLSYIEAHPLQYPQIISQVRALAGVSQKELDLFEAADPSKKM